MSFGWDSDFPVDLGGRESAIASVYRALRANVGQGHAADADGIDWRWREARAIALGAVYGMAEQALSQFHPSTATTGLKFYVELYGLEGYSDQEARNRASQLWLTAPLGGVPGLEQLLQEIDGRFSIDDQTWEQSITTMYGRAFGDWAGAAPFNLRSGRNETWYPNYSTALKVFVQLDTGAVSPTDADVVAMNKAKQLLDEELPAWVDYVAGGPAGFIFDGVNNHLDWNRFDP